MSHVHLYIDSRTGAVRRTPRSRDALSVPEQHQLKIARQTLKLSDFGAKLLGGITKEQAREIIKRLTGKSPGDSLASTIRRGASLRASAPDAVGFKPGDYVKREPDGKVGKVVESDETGTLVQWNGGGSQRVSTSKLSRVSDRRSRDAGDDKRWLVIVYSRLKGERKSITVFAEDKEDAKAEALSRLSDDYTVIKVDQLSSGSRLYDRRSRDAKVIGYRGDVQTVIKEFKTRSEARRWLESIAGRDVTDKYDSFRVVDRRSRDALSDSEFLRIAEKIGLALREDRAREDQLRRAGKDDEANAIYKKNKENARSIFASSGLSGREFDRRLQKLAPGRHLNVKMERLFG